MSRLSSTFRTSSASQSSVYGGKLNNRYVIDISSAVSNLLVPAERPRTTKGVEAEGDRPRHVFEHYYVRNLQEQVFYQEKQLEELRSDVSSLMQKHPAYVEEAHMMMERMRTLELEIRELSEKLSVKRIQSDKQRAETDSSMQHLLRQQSEHSDKRDQLAAKLAALKSDFAEQEAELKDLERTYIEKKSELERMATLSKSHDEQAARLRQQILDVQCERSALQQLTATTARESQEARQQAEELAVRVVDAQTLVNKSGIQKESLTAELTGLQQRVAQLAATHQEELATCGKLQAVQAGLMADKQRLLLGLEEAKKRMEVKNQDPRVRSAAASRQREMLAVMQHIAALESELQQLEIRVRDECARRDTLLKGSADATLSDGVGVNQLALREKMAQERTELQAAESLVKQRRSEIKKLQKDRQRLQKAAVKIEQELLLRNETVEQKRKQLGRVETVLLKFRATQSARWTQFEQLAESIKFAAASALDHGCPAGCKHGS